MMSGICCKILQQQQQQQKTVKTKQNKTKTVGWMEETRLVKKC